MITRLIVRNFKRFDEAVISLGAPVVFVGPNNSGKTTALQALALWELGLRTWMEKRGTGSTAKQRVGVVLNRRDLAQLPVPTTALLWRDKHLRQAPNGGAKATQNILLQITVEGVSGGVAWSCPLEFDYSNDEIVHCRPARLEKNGDKRATIPPEAQGVRMAYLPPMSGLEANERRIDEGAIQVSLGQGKTADVLRNLCWKVWESENQKPDQGEWASLVAQIERLFGAKLNPPDYIAQRGEIQMSYHEVAVEERRQTDLDLSAAGRGFQQTLLLLTFLRWKPGSVVLIDEPDAHLEILRQRQIYAELTETARRLGSQLIVATHSEVVLNEADKDTVVAFVGRPHLLRQSDQLKKALSLLGYEQFLQAEIMGWVLYLEGSTDLESLRILAAKVDPRAAKALEKPFVCYVMNQIERARTHFFGLREAYPSLRGLALFDNTPDITPQTGTPLMELKLVRRELENYFCSPALLRRWVDQSSLADDLFGRAELAKRRAAMEQAIVGNTIPLALNNPAHPFWQSNKVSDEYLPAVFGSFFKQLGLPNSMNKSDYGQLARLLEPAEVDRELVKILDAIATTAAGDSVVS
jgi:hypothetical protein